MICSKRTCPRFGDMPFSSGIMSAQEIIAELPKLSRIELERVDLRLHELLRKGSDAAKGSWGEAIQELAGSVRGLPSDFSANHDHYLHGAPKQ